MDEDGNGVVDFKEFVVAVWNYCTLSPSALVHFAFDLYDRDESGWIEQHEIEQMLQDMYGKKAKHSSASLQRVRDHLETAVRQGTKAEAEAQRAAAAEKDAGDEALAAAPDVGPQKQGKLNVHAAAGVAAATKALKKQAIEAKTKREILSKGG